MGDERLNWISNRHEAFGVFHPQDDLLHPPEANPAGASVTETYYFGFHIAEAAIHGYIYAWFHPNLGVVTAGTLISRGFQSCCLAADYFNLHAYLAAADHVDRRNGELTFPGGLRIRPVRLMEEWALQLDDKSADTAFDLRFTAAMPPAVRGDQKHFDQNMRVEGELRLRGKRYRVDCYEIRDRSWQNLRSEAPMPVPPFDWLTLTIGGDLAMNLALFDDLSVLGNPGGALQPPPQLLQDGWVWRDGEFFRIVSATKRTERSADILRPLRHQITATDDRGRLYKIAGEAVGACNWNGWPNMLWHQCLTRWSCNGEEAWGETQEVQWHDAIRLLRPT